MKLIRQTILHFQKGTSDKVYEVDLCEAGDGKFLVNFRYGRRGRRLREGTKTPFPEAREKAESLYSGLIFEKRAKGYSVVTDAGLPAAAPEPVTPVPDSEDSTPDPRVEAILRRLEKGFAADRWKLSRAVWKAGQWSLPQAMPLLRPLADDATGIDAWSLAWAIGRCGTEADLPTLDKLNAKNDSDETFRRIAAEARLSLLSEPARADFLNSLKADLPSSITKDLESVRTADLAEQINSVIVEPDSPHNLAADLYLLSTDYPVVREALYSAAKVAKLQTGGMLLLRQLFKAAEFRRDAEIYGCIAKRFELDHPSYYDASRSHPKAFSAATRSYLRRRIARTLENAGADGDAASFIPYAVGILLAYDDRIENTHSTNTAHYNWNQRTRNYEVTTIHFPARARSNSFMWLLRGKSPDLVRSKSLNWQFKAEPIDPTTREEPFRELWNEAPDAITHLLAQARSKDVQDFALRVWKDNPNWANTIEVPAIIALLSGWYEPTAELGLELAERHWDPTHPDPDLLLALIDSESVQVRQTGAQWLKDIQGQLRTFPDLLARLSFVQRSDSREAIHTVFSTLVLNQDEQKQTASRIISALLCLDHEATDTAHFAVQSLRQLADGALNELPLDHIANLAAHPLEPLQLLAVRLLIQRGSAETLPEPLLLAALSSTHPAVRSLGLELLGTLPDHQLATRAELIASCATSEHADLREHVRPLIARLAENDQSFSRSLVTLWYPVLTRKETVEGLHQDLLQILTGPLATELSVIPEGAHTALLTSEHAAAQSLGVHLVLHRDLLSETDTDTLIQWTHHQDAQLRDTVWTFLEEHPQHIIDELGAAATLLDSEWDDSRQRAFRFLTDKVPEEAWDPDSLVGICDSTRSEVQDFGCQLITRRFRDEDGPHYLARLSQHPSTALQIFASNFLLRFASGHPDRIQFLEPYFRTVLSRIGEGRTAKKRIFALLESEALADEPTAHLVAQLLTRISATIAIGDKAACITLLQRIQERWPDIATPLTFTPPPLRHAL